MNSLKNLFLFAGLTDAEKDEIISGFSKPCKFKKGEVIYSDDNFRNAMGVILKGKAFAVTNGNSELYMKSFEKGAVFGVASMFCNEAVYVSTIVASTETEVLFIDEASLRSAILKNPQISLNYIIFLSGKIRFLNSKLSMLSASSSEDTLYGYLCSVSGNNGIAAIPKSMTLLAKMLGLSRATLYRCLDTLIESGKITKENNLIKVIKNEKNC